MQRTGGRELQAGYPVGALALLDELTLTLPRRIREETRLAWTADGRDWTAHPAEPVVDRMVDELDRPGRSSGRGFYEYRDGRRTGLWPGLAAAFDAIPTDVPIGELSERMLFAEALESARCLEEGVVRSVAEADVGSILGIGYPTWTGGVIRYVNQYGDGPASFVSRANELADRYGERFRPPQILLYAVDAGRPLDISA